MINIPKHQNHPLCTGYDDSTAALPHFLFPTPTEYFLHHYFMGTNRNIIHEYPTSPSLNHSAFKDSLFKNNFIRYFPHLHFQCYPKSPPQLPPTPLPTHSHFLALAFPCTGAYKVCKSNGPLFTVMAD